MSEYNGVPKPGKPLPSHDIIRRINSKKRPLDLNSKGAQGGLATRMEISRSIAELMIRQMNAAMAKLGQSINIFA